MLLAQMLWLIPNHRENHLAKARVFECCLSSGGRERSPE
jgi:hypothetical protein